MARTFTVSFKHDHQEYTAVISQLQDSVCIYLPDESLHSILPDGRFSYNLQKGLNIDPRGSSPMQMLLLDVLTAIERQEQPQNK